MPTQKDDEYWHKSLECVFEEINDQVQDTASLTPAEEPEGRTGETIARRGEPAGGARFRVGEVTGETGTDERMTGDGERVSGMAKKASSSRNVLKSRLALLQPPREADTDERVAGDGERGATAKKARVARVSGMAKKASLSRNVLKSRLALRPPPRTGPACTPWWTQSGGR